MKLAIVIPCFKRTDSLKRLLLTLDEAIYNQPVDLIFSIDYSGSDKVLNLARDFEWNFGNKRIISHDMHIGLKANILSCGDLTSDYDAIILLEDDLFVSPAFFQYATKSAQYYQKCESIAGISLYSYEVCEIGHFKFYPFLDKFDTYFIQWPSSWGQLWTQKQWKGFKNWFFKKIDINTINIPDEVKCWTQSWKKYFIAYMVDCNKYFVYPYKSFSNEIGKGGTHHIEEDQTYSVNLYQGNTIDFMFRPVDDRATKYDCFFQPVDDILIIDGLEYHVSFNLYGTKKNYNIERDYVITPQKLKEDSIVIKSFSRTLKPFNLNIRNDLSGDFFHLVPKGSINDIRLSPQLKSKLYMPLTTKEMILYVFSKIKSKLFNYIAISQTF